MAEQDFKKLLEQEEKRMAFMYTGMAMCLNTERTLRWSRSAMLTAINGAGLPLLMTPIATPVLHRMIGAVGVLLCFFWFWIHFRTQTYIHYWQSCLAAVEPPEGQAWVFRVFTGTKWREVDGRPNFFHILNVLPAIFIAIWILVFSISFNHQWFVNIFKGTLQ